MRKKIQEVLAYKGPAVCDVDCHEWHSYAPRIFGWKTPIEDMYPYLPREEFKANMYIEPVEGWLTPELPDSDKKKLAAKGKMSQSDAKKKSTTME